MYSVMNFSEVSHVCLFKLIPLNLSANTSMPSLWASCLEYSKFSSILKKIVRFRFYSLFFIFCMPIARLLFSNMILYHMPYFNPCFNLRLYE